MEELKLRRSLVVTEDHETTEKHGRYRIKYVPFWKWVLQSGDNLIHPE
jgi:predicted AAA+ superfamily ATPase